MKNNYNNNFYLVFKCDFNWHFIYCYKNDLTIFYIEQDKYRIGKTHNGHESNIRSMWDLLHIILKVPNNF